MGRFPTISGDELVFTLVLVLNFGQEGSVNDDPSKYVVIICFFSSNYDITSRIKYILLRIIRGIQYAPIKFEIADDLSYWSAEIPGKILAKAEALTGPTTPPGKRVQTINPPGSEVGPGDSQLGEDLLQMRPKQWASNGKEKEDPANIFRLIGMVHEIRSIR
jgi:hypothetical protein